MLNEGKYPKNKFFFRIKIMLSKHDAKQEMSFVDFICLINLSKK